MRILLDTHIMIWMFEDNRHLSRAARDVLLDAHNVLYCSAVSVWEVALKHRRHPAENISQARFVAYCNDAGILPLPLKQEHLQGLEDLPELHSDPFDRALLCQAETEGMRLMTHDGMLARYPGGTILAV